MSEPSKFAPPGGFVSELLGSLLAEGGGENVPPYGEVSGVVLYVDIADSTAMTDEVAALGPDGAERLGGVLSNYFGAVIQVIARHGGDVVRIDGDAVIALWRDDGIDDAPHPLADAPHRLAARAALALGALHYRWPGRSEHLRHRLTLVAGNFATTILSALGKRSFLILTGEPFQTIGAISPLGQPGDVILDGVMARRLGSWADVRPIAGAIAAAHGAVRLENSRDAGPALPAGFAPRIAKHTAASAAAFVPRVVIERGASGLSAWLAEFRVLSVIYARLGGSALSSPEAAEHLLAIFDRVAQATEALGVEIFDTIADEKGILAKIACGIPPFSLENNAARAVAIAGRIHATLAGIGVSCSVGVATGRAFCGDVGNAIRREYVLTGPVMNYGARLMQAAGGQVLYDDATVRATSGQYAFSAGEEIFIKGRIEPVSVYRFAEPRTEPRVSDSRPIALRGRELELASLAAVLDRLRDGQGGLIALEGEPGAGKSRLLAEFRHTADRDGCTTIATAAHEIECATAYFAFRRVLRRLLWRPGDPDDASPVTPRQRLVDALAETGLSPRAALVEDILPLGIEDLGLAAQIRDAARRAGVEDILVALFVSMAAEGGAAHGRAGKGKMLLLVDDLQWIDALSADLLLAVSRRVPDLLIVAASRPIDPDGAPHGARVLRRASQRIALCRLDAGPTAQMIAELLKVRTIPRRLAEFVHEQSEGLPFHAEQLTLSLLQLGLIEVADGRCRVVAADIAKAVVPNRLRDIIVSRIDGLSQTGQLAAKVASVIGRVFELDALREIFPMRTGAESLDESIRGLVRAGILEPAGGTAFAFHHVITQEATYDLLSFAQRRSLHRLVAQGIERRNAAVLQPHFAELAHHWEHAEDTGKALDFRLEAANLAIRRHANDDALMHIDRAERLAARTGFNLPARRRAQIEYVRGEAFHALSRFPEAAKHFGTCLDLSGIRRPATPAQMAVAALGQIGRQGLHRLGLMRRSGNPSRQRRAKLSARVYTRFAEHAYFTNNTLMLVHGTLTALNQAESIGSAPETVEAYGALAIGLGTAGLHGAARYYRDRSISLAEQAGELTGQGVAQLFAAVYSFQAGNWEAVRAHGTKGSAIFERLGDRFRHQSCRVLDCYTALATGDFARAAAGLAAFGPAAEAVDNAPVRAWVLSGMSILDMLHGRSPERTIERMEAAEDAGLHASERLLCDGLEAMARLNMGDIEAARRVAARALERMRDSVCTMGIALFSVCAVAEVHLALVEQAKRSGAPRDGALIRAHEACRAVTRYAAKTRICRPRAHLLKGRLALLNGETTRAAAHFRRSLTEAHILGMPLEEAISQLALARSVRAIEDRRIHAARGAETMRMLGAAPWGAGFWGTDAEADEVGVENRAHYKLDYDETVRV